MKEISLESLDRCLHGIIPGVVATADRHGVPNVSYISQVHLIDSGHVALSCQFFNKTRQNLDENPQATVELYDPLTFEAYRMRLRFQRSETSGPLFETMSARIQAIASQFGMTGIFKLRSADVFEVLSLEKKHGYITVPAEDPPGHRRLPEGPLTELRGLQLVSERVMRAGTLDELLAEALSALHEVFGFSYGMIFLPEDEGRLVVVASHGYGDDAVGAEVRIGDGVIGTVAETRRLVRVCSVDSESRYGQVIRAQYEQQSGPMAPARGVPLPSLRNARSHMAIPLMVEDRLVGVLSLECRDTVTFAQWHEAFLQVLANQIAARIERLADRDEVETPAAGSEAPPAACVEAALRKHSFCYFKNDDCVFVDGEYLIRNVPGKILWKLLRAHQTERRVEFSNRELRLDPSLGMPALKDNLESRLILLRKRLEQKCPDVRIVPTRRGRFSLAVQCEVELVERETG